MAKAKSKFAAFADKFDTLREKLKEQKEEQEKKQSGTFDDSWKFRPSLNNKPKVNYELRILPNVHTELGEPWVKAFFHMFRRPDGKFIYTLCPTTFGKDEKCPICEKSRRLFNSNDQLDEKEARDLYRKARYFANVLIVKDPREGDENQEGQVLVWEFGNQIFDKITEALVEQDLNFYHPTEGHNFNLTIKKRGDFPDYSMSTFSPKSSAISDDESDLDRIFDEIHDLEDKVYGKGAKDYDKLLELMTGDPVESDDEESVSEGRTMDSNTDDDDIPDDSDVTDDDDDDDVLPDANDDDDEDEFDFDFDD